MQALRTPARQSVACLSTPIAWSVTPSRTQIADRHLAGIADVKCSEKHASASVYPLWRDSVTFRDPGAAAFGIADAFRIPPASQAVGSLFSATTKKPLSGLFCSGGEGGIRTRGRLLTYARFPGV